MLYYHLNTPPSSFYRGLLTRTGPNTGPKVACFRAAIVNVTPKIVNLFSREFAYIDSSGQHAPMKMPPRLASTAHDRGRSGRTASETLLPCTYQKAGACRRRL